MTNEEIVKIHNRAMDLAQMAYTLSKKESKEMNRQAFLLEKEAALACPDKLHFSKSIYLKSAVWLAIDCEEFDEAKKLIDLIKTGSYFGLEMQDAIKQINKIEKKNYLKNLRR